MSKKDQNTRVQDRSAEYAAEEARLRDLFEFADESKREIVDGLVKDAAFIAVENKYLREIIAEVGMIRIHPNDPAFQKPLECTKQYRQNVNSYAVIIKTLNTILRPGSDEEDDAFEKWAAERRERKQAKSQPAE